MSPARWFPLLPAAVTLALGLTAGCRTVAPPAALAEASAAETGPEPAPDPRSLEEVAEAHARYSAALIAEMNGRADEALEQFALAVARDPENEWLALQAVERCVRYGKLDRALPLLTNALSRPSASGRLHALAGAIHARLGQREAAIAANQEAIRRSPTLLDGYRNLTLLHVEAKEPAQAHAVLDRALAQGGTEAPFLVGLAELYLGLSRLPGDEPRGELRDDALQALQRAAELKPPDPDLQLKLADGLQTLGESDQAADLYLDLLKRYPDSPVVRTVVRGKLIGIYLAGKDSSRALEHLEQLVRDQPLNALAHYVLATLAQEARRPELAATHFARTITLNPKFEQAYYDLAWAHLGGEKPAEALATLQDARAQFGDTFGVEYISGLAHRFQTNYDAALKALLSAEVIAQATDPTRLNEFLYFQLGVTFERKGDFPQAARYFEKAIDLAPKFAEALNYLGYMLADRNEDLARARDLIERAVALEPENGAFLDSLGWVLFRLGKTEEALPHLLKAAELLKPPDPVVFDHLGDVYAALGEMDKAREFWRKALDLGPDEKIKQKLDAPAARRN